MSSRLLTVTELLQAPTGVDWNTIAENAGAASPVQAIEEANVIDRASAWVSAFCQQRLDATTNSETARLARNMAKTWVDRDGWLWFHTDLFPVLSVSAMSWAQAGAGMAPANFTALVTANLQLYGDGGRVNRIADYSQDWSWLRTMTALIELTYVNGYPNAMLAANTPIAGSAVTLQVDTTLGMSATAGAVGNTLTIYDGANTEVVTVQSVTDATHVVVTTLAHQHNAAPQIRVSALPADVNEAMVLACMDFARERGTMAWQMSGGGGEGPSVTRPGTGGALEDAEYLLQPYRRVPV